MNDNYNDLVLNPHYTKAKNLYTVFKRLFDIVISLLSIIILFPIAIILMILIKIDSKGPIFYLHKRLGLNGKVIRIYKFRTMVYNSDEIFNNFTKEQKLEYEKKFKLDDDPRLTRLGKFLRGTSIDELPQLLNIFKGEMSLVGPRPIVEKEVEKYGMYAQKFFSVKPGLTGFWQANGRSSTTYDERVQMDMFYVDHRCLRLDIKIIFKTFYAVFRQNGAI